MKKFKTNPMTRTRKSFKCGIKNKKKDESNVEWAFGIPHSKRGPLTASIVQHLIWYVDATLTNRTQAERNTVDMANE